VGEGEKMKSTIKCFTCESECEATQAHPFSFIICPTCGDYKTHIDTIEALAYEPKFKSERHLFSGYFRRCKEFDIPKQDFLWPKNRDSILFQSFVPRDNDVERKLSLYLQHIDKQCAAVSDTLNIQPKRDYPVGFCHNGEELYLFSDFLRQSGLIDFDGAVRRDAAGTIQLPGNIRISITVAGKSKCVESVVQSKQVFVATEFSDEMLSLFSGIRKDVEQATGYKLALVNDFKHNGTIDNKIIAEINRSAALIAEFSSNNRGAYYEAGYAHGQGKEVIFICRDAPDPNSKDQKRLIDGVHFDTRQRNHILWRNAEHLKTELTDWILATLSRK
jgi:nucleoside 2-deoxyribosyltransferase